jgi:CheY-like chemotaxis protein
MATILVASEDHAAVQSLSAELSADGHVVITAADGQDACAKALAEAPDLVFLDMTLTVFDGHKTCALLRADPGLPPTHPILLLTSTRPNAKALEKVGATGCFPKRHEVRELRDLLVKYLGVKASP